MGRDSSFDRVDLGRAVDALYDAFDTYPLKAAIDCCPHCELGAAERQLHVRPLRQMRWSDFGPYPVKALTSFGDEGDLKHFLPRILELYVSDHAGAPYTLFMFFGKLDGSTWTTWPAAEVAAIRRVVDAWQRALVNEAHASEERAWELDELRAGISAL